MRVLVLFGACLAMSVIGGCGKVYVAPTGNGSAQIKIENQTGEQLGAVYFDGVEKCTKPESVGSVNPGGSLATRVTTDHPATFAFQRLSLSQGFAGLTVKSCILAMSFQPEVGKYYLVELNSDEDRCYVNLKQLEGGKSSQSRFVERSYQNPFVESQGFCSRLTDTQRTSLIKGDVAN